MPRARPRPRSKPSRSRARATKPRATAPSVYPALFYRDARLAIAWLKDAFGFREKLFVPGTGDAVAHAELAFGGGVIMVGTAQPAKGWLSPRDLAGVPQGVYLHVRDPDAHYERAKRAGAVIEYAPRVTEYGSREYGARDPEGHFWSFGTYRPRA